MIEATVIAYLAQQGFEAYAELPADVGLDSFRAVTVERTGGTSLHRGLIGTAVVAVQSWAESTAAAAELAEQVDRALAELPDHVAGVARCERNSLYRFPAAQRPRYQGTYDIVYSEV